MCFIALGHFVDYFSPKITIPLAYLIRGVALVIVSRLHEPGSKSAFILWGFYAMGYLLQYSALEGYLAKNIKNEIRGVLYGLAGVFAACGKGLSILVGRRLQDRKESDPLLFIGLCDLTYLVVVLACIIFGRFGEYLSGNLEEESESQISDTSV